MATGKHLPIGNNDHTKCGERRLVANQVARSQSPGPFSPTTRKQPNDSLYLVYGGVQSSCVGMAGHRLPTRRPHLASKLAQV